MRHWTFWEWLAYGSLFVAALIMAAETGFKTEPEVMAHLPSFFQSALWGFSPAALVVFATIILILREFIFYPANRSPIGTAVAPAHPDIARSSTAPPPLSIELGTGSNYECVEHFPANGLVRRSIKIAIVNRSADDVADCNVRLIAATPPAMIGDSPAAYPILFTKYFDLATGKRKYVKIISLVESGWQIEWQKHSITIHVAVGGGWVSKGWTTLSPLPAQANPGVLTFEAFAPGIASSQAQVKIWVDETLGRKLCAGIG
jgi:hypothetical protein